MKTSIQKENGFVKRGVPEGYEGKGNQDGAQSTGFSLQNRGKTLI
jgi:hypothetical protein